jgi:hypothetical protein
MVWIVTVAIAPDEPNEHNIFKVQNNLNIHKVLNDLNDLNVPNDLNV